MVAHGGDGEVVVEVGLGGKVFGIVVGGW